MKAKDTYNAIIKDIEGMILDLSLKSQEIVIKIEHKYVYDARELKAVFRFLTGITPLEYVRNRRLMASYECLVNQKVRDVAAACAITQYDSQHFSNSFKAKFGMTPTIRRMLMKAISKKTSRSLLTSLTRGAPLKKRLTWFTPAILTKMC